jgi:hypothetical protein
VSESTIPCEPLDMRSIFLGPLGSHPELFYSGSQKSLCPKLSPCEQIHVLSPELVDLCITKACVLLQKHLMGSQELKPLDNNRARQELKRR